MNTELLHQPARVVPRLDGFAGLSTGRQRDATSARPIMRVDAKILHRATSPDHPRLEPIVNAHLAHAIRQPSQVAERPPESLMAWSSMLCPILRCQPRREGEKEGAESKVHVNSDVVLRLADQRAVDHENRQRKPHAKAEGSAGTLIAGVGLHGGIIAGRKRLPHR